MTEKEFTERVAEIVNKTIDAVRWRDEPQEPPEYSFRHVQTTPIMENFRAVLNQFVKG